MKTSSSFNEVITIDIRTNIIQAITVIARQVAYNIPRTEVLNGRVVGISGSKYVVEINNQQFTMPSISSETFVENSAVWVCRPQNSIENQFILGRRVT